jgi:hypothetical protein
VSGDDHAPAALAPQRGPWSPMKRGLVGFPDSVDILEKRKISSVGVPNPDHAAISLVIVLTPSSCKIKYLQMAVKHENLALSKL